MSSRMISQFLSSMAVQAPTLLVCAAGLVAAAIFLRRYPRPAVLTLIGTTLLLLSAPGFSLAQGYILDTLAASDRSSMERASMLTVLGIAHSCLRAVGLGLILLAVFAGRRREQIAPEEHL